MEEVEGAIQRVLAACQEFNVPCGITAGVADVATRLQQGFRFIIATDAETIRVGKAAAGRDG
jgi:non-canonical (house-cleaning) NTP pyrophosphatase